MCHECTSLGFEIVTNGRLVRLWPYAAALGFVGACVAAFVVFEGQAGSDLWSRAVGLVEANWRRAFGSGGRIIMFTTALLLLELVFLDWKKTTIFLTFVQRGKSAISDFGFTVVYFTPLKRLAEYAFTFGGAYLTAKFVNAAAENIGWFRLELPTEGILPVAAGFAVFYLISSFIGYWHHRLLHTRWCWHLHRFHHAAPDLNIFTGFRDNPAAGLLNVPLALQSLLILKMPDASLFAAFFLTNQVIATLQHSQLPWSLGWVGRWVVASPQNHQFHHSIDEEHRDKNFSNCPLWDHLFGTWYGGPKLPSGFGIPDRAHIERPLSQWLIDVWIFYRDTVRSLAGLVRSGIARISRGQRVSQTSEAPVLIPLGVAPWAHAAAFAAKRCACLDSIRVAPTQRYGRSAHAWIFHDIFPGQADCCRVGRKMLRDGREMNVEDRDILANLERYKFYHRIELPGGIVTPGHRAGEPQQDLVRRNLDSLEVRGKRVLDVGCRDGLFCFEAERRGASEVIGIDNELSHGATEFLIPHLKSDVKMYEMNVIDLASDTFGKFDLIICPGVLYHLRYPFVALPAPPSAVP